MTSIEARARIARILDDCTLTTSLGPAWFHVRSFDGCEWIQLRFKTIDSATGQPATQNGRKWIISRHATDSEIVQTVFLALLTAAEHEVREAFRYRGQAIFGPHFSAERLALFAANPTNHDARPDPAPAET